MNEIINQIKRLWSDDGRNDRNFTKEEIELKLAKDNLNEALARFIIAADKLTNTLLRID